MSQKEEFERYNRRGEFPNKEPLEPDEFYPEEMTEHLNVKDIHLPKEPITEQSLKVFLSELKPILRDIQSISKEDQHEIAEHLHRINKFLKRSDISKDIVDLFAKIALHFGALHKHYTTANHSETLFALQKVLNRL